MFVHDSTAELWSDSTVKCVLVPHDHQLEGRDLGPDLIVVDYGLPDLPGAEVCRRLRENPETAGTPIIAVTASPEALRAEGCTADAVLTKPCPTDTLVGAARLFVRHLACGTDATS